MIAKSLICVTRPQKVDGFLYVHMLLSIDHLLLEKERLIQRNSGFNHSVIVNTIYKAYVLRELKIIFVPMNKIYYYQFNKQV